MLNRCQNANLIESILSFLDGERLEGDFFERVDLLVRLSANFEHLTERAAAELLNDFKVLNAHSSVCLFLSRFCRSNYQLIDYGDGVNEIYIYTIKI